jgi:aminodeoxyfutalosine synthase
MTSSALFDRYLDRLDSDRGLSFEDAHDLAALPDVLSLGMLADVVRRRLHGSNVTYLRVAESPVEVAFADGVATAARELRLAGSARELEGAVHAVESTRAVAGDRTVSAFSWVDVKRWSAQRSLSDVLLRLRSAGLDALAEVPLDAVDDPASVVTSLAAAGFDRIRLTFERAAPSDYVRLLVQAGRVQEACRCIQAINPLPMSLAAFRPTTGYDDVKAVAISRLAALSVPSIQVDWQRYGPKLAQVALAFGADDIDGVSASDEAPAGRRRAPLEEIRRNIEAAGFQPVERDGRFVGLD